MALWGQQCKSNSRSGQQDSIQLENAWSCIKCQCKGDEFCKPGKVRRKQIRDTVLAWWLFPKAVVLPHQDFSINQFSTTTLSSGRRHPLPSVRDGSCTPCSQGWFPLEWSTGFPKPLPAPYFLPWMPVSMGKVGLCLTLANALVRAVRVLLKLPADVDCRQWLLLTLGVLWGFQEQKLFCKLQQHTGCMQK